MVVEHESNKLQHWRAVSSMFCLKGAPVLEVMFLLQLVAESGYAEK